jgi:hypothetical protein
MQNINRRVAALDQAQESNRARVRRYRAKHQRIDFVPSPDVLQIIEHHFKAGMDSCLVGVIDNLVRAGHQAITGNGANGK